VPSQDTPNLTVRIGDRVVDCAPVLPFKLGDWEKLKAQGIDPIVIAMGARDGKMSLAPMTAMTVHAIRKAAPDLTAEQIMDAIGIGEAQRIFAGAMAMEDAGPVDRPTSTPFSTSPSGGGGDLATLPA
jgi:hypothetical protein